MHSEARTTWSNSFDRPTLSNGLRFFFLPVLGLSGPWLFNKPPAKTKDSKQQTSSLLNGSKANFRS